MYKRFSLRHVNRRDGLLLLTLWLICVLLDGFLIHLHQAPPAWDQGEHLSRAIGIWEVLRQPAPWSGGWWQNLWAQAPSYRGPLTYVLSAPVLELLGQVSGAQWPPARSSTAFCCYSYGLGRQLHSRCAGLWSALL